MNDERQHDVAWAISLHVFEVFKHLVREDQHAEAFAAIFKRVKAGLEIFAEPSRGAMVAPE